MSKKLCVGLFGTCGGSEWRKPFIEAFDEKGIDYFNPQIDDWEAACAEAAPPSNSGGEAQSVTFELLQRPF